MVRHRVHVLSHGLDDHHESWCSPDGAVVLLRDVGSRMWRAVLDFVVVTDVERLHGHALETVQEAAMQAPTPQALAQMLARQEHVHLVFDP